MVAYPPYHLPAVGISVVSWNVPASRSSGAFPASSKCFFDSRGSKERRRGWTDHLSEKILLSDFCQRTISFRDTFSACRSVDLQSLLSRRCGYLLCNGN